MDKTFAESQGQPAFDWNKWLDAAIEKHPGTAEWYMARELATSWVTCACGNQCAIIPRATETINTEKLYRYAGAPMDQRLYMLGCDFLDCIECEDFQSAKSVLFEIELRSAELIAEQLAALKANQEGRR